MYLTRVLVKPQLMTYVICTVTENTSGRRGGFMWQAVPRLICHRRTRPSGESNCRRLDTHSVCRNNTLTIFILTSRRLGSLLFCHSFTHCALKGVVAECLNHSLLEFRILSTVLIKIQVFWFVTSCTLVTSYWRLIFVLLRLRRVIGVPRR